ncbi:MAG: helix-hairpin-helix domain-containing protein [Candidatus Zixiibacteriota bacterium]
MALLKTKSETRSLSDLRSVGQATVEDLRRLGITSVGQLKGRSAKKLYDKICRITGMKHDICVLDVFQCAIAQAENPDLPAVQRDWFYWSKVRKRA